MSSTDTPLPHDPNTLYRLARRAIQRLGVPVRWQADAVAEYVMAAWKAGQRTDHPGNVQAYQCLRGRGAVMDFVRRERRQEALAPGSCIVEAKRVSMEKMVMDSGGEWIPLSETIMDKNMPQPDARMLEAERNEAVRRALEELDPETRSVVQRIWLDGRSQTETAKELGLSRQKVQRLLDAVRARLRRRLAEYEPDFNRTRY